VRGKYQSMNPVHTNIIVLKHAAEEPTCLLSEKQISKLGADESPDMLIRTLLAP